MLCNAITSTFNSNQVINEPNTIAEQSTDPFGGYNPFAFADNAKIVWTVVGIIVATLIVMYITIHYYVNMKKLKPNEVPKGFTMLIFILINYAKQLVFEILGPNFIKFTPYFLTLFLYIMVSNMVDIVGFENPTGSLTVTLSMGLVTFFGTFIIGFRYQRLSYLKKFAVGISIKNKKTNKKTYIPVMINPLEVIGSITPLISISMRLWGNIFAGGVIIAMFYSIPMAFTGNNPLNPQPLNAYAWTMIMGLFAAPFNAYLGVMVGTIQALVFTMLTMVYWTLAQSEESVNEGYKFVPYDSECYIKLNNVSELKE